MLTLAITGGIACGKSLTAAMLCEAGVPVCEADRLAHEAVRKGGPVYPAVVEEFGAGILDEAGEIDRAALGDIVFGSAEARERINAMVHPCVRTAWRNWLRAQAERGDAPLASVVVPLLFEIGDEANWDAIVCVSARRELRVRRLAERGLTERQIEQRLAAQWPLKAKESRSDYVLVNDGEVSVLREQAMRMLGRIRGADYGQ
jgi:dephospho-CoA kinase